jgi:hemerythrin superfamily protein
MKATDVIKRDHRAAEELFANYQAAPSGEREELAEQIFQALDAHEKMEDTYFYPALMAAAPDMPGLEDLEREQEELKAEVSKVRAMPAGDEREERLESIMETVLAHAKKEEAEILDPSEDILDADKLEELGQQMEPESAVALI